MKKRLLLLFISLLASCSLCACKQAESGAASDGDRLQIVTTIFPEYDWVMAILGSHADRADVTMLLDSGVDPHSYQPTADDIMRISGCDMFIYVGGESDEWVEDALRDPVNRDMVSISLLEVLGDSVREEEVIEGMQEEDGEHEEEPEADEHVWLSLRNAATLVGSISDSIQRADPDYAADYRANTAAYIEKLNELDGRYEAAIREAPFHTLLFGDRFPFRYLVDDYGLDYYAAFAGCSAETEASFETITFLAQRLDELGLPAVVTIEGADHRIAETIIQNTQSKDQQILTLDSMQSSTSQDAANGTTYLAIMENNLSTLSTALGVKGVTGDGSR